MPSPPITPEQWAALPPKLRAVVQAILDHYERRIADYERRIADLQAEVAELKAERAELKAEVAELKAERAELKAELAAARKTPRNSSLPPSSEHPHAKPPLPKPKSKRKRGGQPGHEKHQRALIPSEDCQTVVPCKPECCRRCGKKLGGSDPEPLRHQVWEIPDIQPQVTEYQLHRLECSCGTTTCGALPPGVPTGQAGPRLIALTALLMGCFRQSKRRVALFLEQVLNQPCSPGWVVKLQNLATAALQPS
jgi:transposase